MKTKKSTWLPLLLLVYLMVMAYVGADRWQQASICNISE